MLHLLNFGNIARYVRRTPHPVIVTIRDDKDYIRALFYSYYTTITGWGVLLKDMVYGPNLMQRMWELTGPEW